MPQYITHKPRRASDENWVLILLSITVIAVLCMFAVGYLLTSRWNAQEETRIQQRQLDAYLDYTAPKPAPPMPVEFTQAQQIRARLLAHPGVTPGPGFDRPGVQSTGIAIVDAIDDAQAKRR
jgi:cell division protein FtsX